MRQRRRVSILRPSIQALPDAVVRARPALGIGLVGPLLTSGVAEGFAERLDRAETLLRGSGESALRQFARARSAGVVSIAARVSAASWFQIVDLPLRPD